MHGVEHDLRPHHTDQDEERETDKKEGRKSKGEPDNSGRQLQTVV